MLLGVSSAAQEGTSRGSMNITIMDGLTGDPVAVRVRVTRDDHVVKNLPQQAVAVMYGVWDHADGYGFLPDSAFYVDGTFHLLLPEGQYHISHDYRGLMLDGLRRRVDFLELLQFCASEDPLQLRHYYHLLELGYAVTAVAGSDFPWCGKDHDH